MWQAITSLKLYLMQQDKTNHHKLHRAWEGKHLTQLELQGKRNSITAQFNAVKVGHQLEQVPRGNIFQEV